jgi:hypothetical protein
VKLVLAAPDSFLSATWVSHAIVASFSHFFMKLVSAAPASFFVVAVSFQLSATAPVTARLESNSARTSRFIVSS